MDEFNTYLVNKNIELKKELKKINEKYSEILQKQIKSIFYEYEIIEVIEMNLGKSIEEIEETLYECKKFIIKMKEIKKSRPLVDKTNI